MTDHYHAIRIKSLPKLTLYYEGVQSTRSSAVQNDICTVSAIRAFFTESLCGFLTQILVYLGTAIQFRFLAQFRPARTLRIISTSLQIRRKKQKASGSHRRCRCHGVEKEASVKDLVQTHFCQNYTHSNTVLILFRVHVQVHSNSRI